MLSDRRAGISLRCSPNLNVIPTQVGIHASFSARICAGGRHAAACGPTAGAAILETCVGAGRPCAAWLRHDAGKTSEPKPSAPADHGHLTMGGIDDRMESTFPPVFSPNTVPRS